MLGPSLVPRLSRSRIRTVAMDVKRFYTSKRKDPVLESSAEAAGSPVKQRHQASQVQLSSAAKPAPKRLLEPQGVWKEFPRQRMAFEFASTCWQDVAVFAYESEALGKQGLRRYLVSTYYEFGQQYLSMTSSQRHHYEIITEGSACHLYFDIEFQLDCNPHVDGRAALEVLIEYVCYQLHVQFGLKCSRTNILDLESSTKQKFSRHLIFHLPGAVFRNNTHAGNFVHYICDKLRELERTSASGVNRAPSSDTWLEHFLGGSSRKKGHAHKGQSSPSAPSAENLLSLFVLNEKGQKVLICDEGVYTRNRNFRLYLSSKLGKKACLRVAEDNKYRSSYGENMEDRRKSQLFNTLMDSLICNVRFDQGPCWLLEFESPDGKALKRRRATKAGTSAISMDSTPAELVEGYSCSPYPRVDAFITSRLVRGGVQGSIRHWTHFPQGKLMVYDIQHNRWCENIGRAHKSNNIMIIADLVRGVYYQKCHDPECRRIDYRSQECAIPAECNPVIQPHCEPQQASNPTHHSSNKPTSTSATTTATCTGDEDVSVPSGGVELDVETPSCLSDEDFLERVANELDVPGETHGPERWSAEEDKPLQSQYRWCTTEQEPDVPGEIDNLNFWDLEEEDWMHEREEGEVTVGQEVTDIAETIGGGVGAEEWSAGSTGGGDQA